MSEPLKLKIENNVFEGTVNGQKLSVKNLIDEEVIVLTKENGESEIYRMCDVTNISIE